MHETTDEQTHDDTPLTDEETPFTDEQAPFTGDDPPQEITTDQAAALVGLSVGQFRRECHRFRIESTRQLKRGKVRHNLYSLLDIQYLKARRAEETAEQTDAQPSTNDGRTDTDVISGVPNTTAAVALRGVILQVYADNMALQSKYDATLVRLGSTEVERDEARARLRDLEAVQQVEPPVKRHPRWMFWK